MPVERQAISTSQLAELLGVDPSKFVAVELRTSRERVRSWYVVTEGADMQTRPGTTTCADCNYVTGRLCPRCKAMQTSGTFPETNDNKTRGPRKGGKRGK
jgi:hypothetical protein